jgi:hypothetical protein
MPHLHYLANQPALFFRVAMQKVGYPLQLPEGAEFNPSILREHCQRAYTESYNEDQRRIQKHASLESIRNGRAFTGLYAVGLFACGDLDKVAAILDAIPIPYEPNVASMYQLMAGSIKALLPLPVLIDPLQNPNGVRTWVQTHRDVLVWSEALGKYYIEGLQTED